MAGAPEVASTSSDKAGKFSKAPHVTVLASASDLSEGTELPAADDVDDEEVDDVVEVEVDVVVAEDKGGDVEVVAVAARKVATFEKGR